MRTFEMQLFDSTHSEILENVVSFVGEDDSGSFGIMSGHVRMMTTLVMGLSRYTTSDNEVHYLALTGGVLCFRDGRLTINTRHFLIDNDYMSISSKLKEQLLVEESQLLTMKDSLHQLEEEVLKHLWNLGKN